MLELNSFMIFSENPKVLNDFYSKVFQKDPDWEDGEYYGYLMGKTFISFGAHDKVKGKSKNPERFMFNLETSEVQEEFDRIKKLGATVIAEPYHMGEDEESTIATFADPDGNYFQLTTPWEPK